MDKSNYEHFICIVAGDNPNELVLPFSKDNNITRTLRYKFADAKSLHENYVTLYRALFENETDIEKKMEMMNELQYQLGLTDEEFFEELTQDMEIDEETGDAYVIGNPNAKYSRCRIGGVYAVPFLLETGEEKYSAKKADVDWSKMHLNGQEIYRRAWEMVMEDSKPENDYEKEIYENMKNRISYFDKFKTKENYVISSTAFWGYAFCDKNGWVEPDDETDQFQWMSNFYEKFIETLDDNTIISIYECTR